MARRRFFVDSVHSGRSRIAGPDAHHLTRVLRVAPGQKYEISDNQSVYLAEVETARHDLVSFAILERLEPDMPPLRLALYASLIRFERFEWIVEKATEMGVERVIPVETDRSEKGLLEAAHKRITRWTRIAREASEQSRRAHLPEVGEPVRLAEALQPDAAHKYVLEEGDAPAILGVLPAGRAPSDTVAMLAGPEGGWTDRERNILAEAGWKPVSLGVNILRAETAAVAGIAILTAAWQAARGPIPCGHGSASD